MRAQRFRPLIEYSIVTPPRTDRDTGGTVGGPTPELASTPPDSCSPQQRTTLLFSPDDEDRTRWFYTPTDHGGLPLSAQRPAQQQLTMRLVAAGLSEASYNTVAAVIGIENVLGRVEHWERDWGR